jgi:integrase/recombinase XerD
MKEERIIAEDPAAAIPVPKQEKQVPRYVSVAQIESLLNQPNVETPAGLRDRALLEEIYSAGLRISEALTLEIGDIDYQQGFVYIRHGKRGSSRNIPIGNGGLCWLKTLSLGRPQQTGTRLRPARIFIIHRRTAQPAISSRRDP